MNVLKSTKLLLHYPTQTWKGHYFNRQIIKMPFSKGNQPITLHIDYVHFSDSCLNIVQGFLEKDQDYSTLYYLTISGWPSRCQTVSCIVQQFWGAQGKLSIDNELLLKSTWLCIPPKLHDRCLTVHDHPLTGPA